MANAAFGVVNDLPGFAASVGLSPDPTPYGNQNVNNNAGTKAYHYDKADGNVTIRDLAGVTSTLTDVASTDVAISRAWNAFWIGDLQYGAMDAVLTVKSTGGQITLMAEGGPYYEGLANVTFSDGVSLSWSQINAAARAQATVGVHTFQLHPGGESLDLANPFGLGGYGGPTHSAVAADAGAGTGWTNAGASRLL